MHFFNSSFGAKRLNALRFAMNSMIGNSRMFTDADFLKEIGKTMPDPRVENNQYLGNSTKWVENADYFRCENVTLAYDFPKKHDQNSRPAAQFQYSESLHYFQLQGIQSCWLLFFK